MMPREEFDCSPQDFPIGRPCWNDASFQTLLERHPKLQAMTDYLPSDLKTVIFEGQREIETLRSSYKDHGYGYFFYALTQVLKPTRCVEIGVLQGFSLLTVAAALRDNQWGYVHGFDLFEDYPYSYENYGDVLQRIKACGLQGWAQAHRADAFQVHEYFDSLDYLHVDISNNGDTYRQIFANWASKVGHVILLEGGSAARDRVEWMVKYEKPSIVSAIKEIARANQEWTITVLEPYPSLTVAIRSDSLAGLRIL